MPYIGTAKESVDFLGRNKLVSNALGDFPEAKFTASGVGPYTLPDYAGTNKYNAGDPGELIDVWVGGVHQDSTQYTVSGKELTFLSVPQLGREILVKFRVRKVNEGVVAAKSVGDVRLADNAITNPKLTGSDGFVGWDADGNSVSLSNPGIGLQNKYNNMLNTFRIQRNSGLSIQNMVDGISDEFSDETGIDLTGSTNISVASSYVEKTVSADNSILLSNEYAANLIDPVEVMTVVGYEFPTSGNLNSEFNIEVSRDSGVTWNRIILATKTAEVNSGVGVAVGNLDISNQPSGSGMRYRINMPFDNDVRIHAVSLQWRY